MSSPATAIPENIPDNVPRELVVDFDCNNVCGPREDLHLAWKRLHLGPDIVWTPRNGGHWIVTRAEDIEEVYRNHEYFTTTLGQIVPLVPIQVPLPPINFDPPEHTFYRKLMVPFFSPKAVAELEKSARELSIELIESFCSRGECEFYGDFALRMPVGILLSLLAFPDSDRLRLLKIADTGTRSGTVEGVSQAWANAISYLEVKLEEFRAKPNAGLLSVMMRADVDGRKLTHDELLGIGMISIFAGLDTVASTFSFIANFLACNPGHRQQLIEEPGLIRNAVEELLRRFPVTSLGRAVLKNMQFKGLTFKRGDAVIAPSVLGSLDERRFPDPLTVDFTRKNAAYNLTFGFGAHKCIGSLLARTELRVFLEEWLKRIPQFGLAPGKQPTAKSGNVMAIIDLPLSWH
jgi:cytochrome P450